MNELKEQGSKAYLISIVMVAVLGGLLFGYDTAVMQVLSSAVLSDLLFPDSWPRTWDERNR